MTTEPPPISCPSCGRSSHSFKISLLYIQAVDRLTQRPLRGQEGSARAPVREAVDIVIADMLLLDGSIDREGMLRSFARAFAPPEPPRPAGSPPIHPDWMVMFGAVIGLLFSAWIFFQSRGIGGIAPGAPAGNPLIPLSILAGFVLFYLLTRQPVIARYQARRQAGQDSHRQHALAAERWLRLYICSLEPVVFDPELQIVRPIERIKELLYPEHP